MSESNIIIIGGGLSGLSIALAFERKGIPVTLYEKRPQITSEGAGIVLGANALKALNLLGVGEEVKALGFSTNKCAIKSDSGKVLTVLNYESTSVPNYTFIHRKDLIQILTNAISPETIVYDKKLLDFNQTEDSLKLQFEDGENINTKYVIASDGIHSVIRKKLLPEKSLRYAGYTCWRGILDDVPQNIEKTYSETWGPRGRFGIVPLSNNRLYWYALKNCTEHDIEKVNWTSIDLLFNFFYYHDPIQQILEKTNDESIIRNDIYDIDPLLKYEFGNILLTGDCAHAATPNMGQGACQAIEDAIYLSTCVENTKTIEEAFLQFEQKRLEHTSKLVKDSWRLGKVAQMEIPLLCSLRNKMIQITPSSFHHNRIRNIFEVDAYG